MQNTSHPGKFFVFEGIDGSGKSTQSALLKQRLEEEGHSVVTFDFPQYGEKSAGLVEEYLAGKYGSLEEIGPYEASIFYAVDRYDLSFQIRDWLAQGKTLVSDRYVGSNIGHQGGKIREKEKREEFFRWLFDLEYSILKAPKPTVSIFLQVPPEIAFELCQNEERRKTKKSDIHEENIQHLKDAESAYLHAAHYFPDDFTVIQCVDSTGNLLSPEQIHEKIWKNIQSFL